MVAADRTSFTETSRWVDEVRSERGNDVIVVLVGNKSDAVDERQVSMEEGDAKAREMGVMFLETSAKAGFNIKALFHKVASALPAAPYDSRSASNSAHPGATADTGRRAITADGSSAAAPSTVDIRSKSNSTKSTCCG